MPQVEGTTKLLYKYKGPIDQPIRMFLNLICGLFTKSPREWYNSLLICVEDLTNWSLARGTKNPTAVTIIKFFKEDLFHSFGPPRTIISNKSSWFLTLVLKKFEEEHGRRWKTLQTYKCMPNGKGDSMVGTLNNSIGGMVNNGQGD